MQTHQWKFFRWHKVVRFVVRTSMIVLLGTSFMGAEPGIQKGGTPVLAHGMCSNKDYSYDVVKGDTLGGIAARYAVSMASLAQYNRIVYTNLIYVGQKICFSGRYLGSILLNRISPSAVRHVMGRVMAQMVQRRIRSTRRAMVGEHNAFPYGACTWWADQRYYQLHGVFVPWQGKSDAWQWTTRAQEFGWHVSHAPHVGDIVDLQPGVQGAYGLGHVAIVERVLTNGHIIASSMSWGVHPWAVTRFQFVPGPGVTFIGM